MILTPEPYIRVSAVAVSTVARKPSSAKVAGPASTSPFSIENLLPWHSQLIVPSETLDTTQPWCVQIAVKHLNSPALGWVTTTSSSAKIAPPPMGGDKRPPLGDAPGTYVFGK